MNTLSSLQAITDKVRKSGRIGFADVQRLQRDILADGIGSRGEAELLIGLDRNLAKRDPAWNGFLVAAMVDFVVWSERATGVVDEDTARWLQALLAGTASSRTARVIAREISQEAQAFENDALIALEAIGKSRSTARRPRAAAVAPPANVLTDPACQPAL